MKMPKRTEAFNSPERLKVVHPTQCFDRLEKTVLKNYQ